jgi:hypothetical protein
MVGTGRRRVRTIVVAALVGGVAAAALADGMAGTHSRVGGEQRDALMSNGHLDPDGPIGRS